MRVLAKCRLGITGFCTLGVLFRNVYPHLDISQPFGVANLLSVASVCNLLCRWHSRSVYIISSQKQPF